MKKYLSLLLASLAICPLFSEETTSEEPKEEQLVALNEVATEETSEEPAIEAKMADLEPAEETTEETKIEE